MSQFRIARLSMILAALGLNLAPALMTNVHAAGQAAAAEAAKPADSVRPELFKLIDPKAMKELMDAKNYTEVQSRIDQAAALPNLTAYESFVLNRLRVAVASATNNPQLAMTALEAVIESGRLSAAEKGDFIQALANYYYNAKDYPKAITWFKRYETETGDQVKVRPYIIRAYYFGNDFENAKTALMASLQNNQTGKAPALEDLQLLANTGAKTKDKPTYLFAMEKLVQYYPSDDYWSDLLNRMQSKPTYSNHLELDVLRLQKVAVKTMSGDEYYALAELAMLGAFSTEAKQALDAGFAAGVLGTGPKAADHKKLRERANKGAADDAKNIAAGDAAAMKSKEGTGLVNLGYAYVTMGDFDKGIDMIKKGIDKGGLKRPEDAKLRLGAAYALAGRKDQAITALEAVKGAEGQADLARYWTFWVNRPATSAAPAAAQ